MTRNHGRGVYAHLAWKKEIDECGEVDVSRSGNSRYSDCLPKPEPSSGNDRGPRICKDYESVGWRNGI